VPRSRAIGTGSALYALASQNFPSIRIAIGSSDALPSSERRSNARARGPVSFFFVVLRSPTGICGRSSCATAEDTVPTTHAQTIIARLQSSRTQCKLLEHVSLFQAPAILFALCSLFPGELGMNINDKAPAFSLPDENENAVALKDLAGKTVVLFFYPRANTPG